MPALYLDWPNRYSGEGGDLQTNAAGSLATASGSTLAVQKLIRSLLNNPRDVQPDGTVLPPDYIYDTTFGDGLCRRLGDSYSEADLLDVKAVILAGIATIDEIAPLPAPLVSITPANGGLIVVIKYWGAQTNRPQSIGFMIPKS